MIKRPFISIIILSALRRECTAKCLSSIKKNTKCDYEIIVVDMGLSESIQAWLRDEALRDSRIKLIFNNQNVGTTRGRNQALAVASGEEIMFLDNDAMLTEDWDKNVKEGRKKWGSDTILGAQLICSNGYVYFCDQYIICDSSVSPKRVGLNVMRLHHKDEPQVNEEKYVPWYPGCGMVMRRVLALKLNGFCEDLWSIEEDKDLCFRASELNKKIIYYPALKVIHDRAIDDQYERKVRYANPDQLAKDISYLEQRWNCRVELTYSKKWLKTVGYSDELIAQMKDSPMSHLFKIVS